MDEHTVKRINQCLTDIASGDHAQADVLYLLCGHHLFGYAVYILHNHHDAQEVISNIWAKINKISAGYRFLYNGYNYLLKITKNESLNYIKKYRKDALCYDFSEFSLAMRDDIAISEDKIALRQAIAQLPKEERDIVFWIRFRGIPVKKIAQRLHKSSSTVYRIYDDAIEHLKDFLTKD